MGGVAEVWGGGTEGWGHRCSLPQIRGLRGGRIPPPPHPTGPRRGAASGALQRLGEWFYEVEVVLGWAERLRRRRLRRKNAYVGRGPPVGQP